MIGRALLLSRLLERGARIASDEEIVTAGSTGVHRETYAEMRGRACQLAHVLAEAGVREGDRVATLMWNSHRHLETFYAVPSMGAVLHALNPRLSTRELAYSVQHAHDRVLLVDQDLIDVIEPVLARTDTIKTVLVATSNTAIDASRTNGFDWEEAIARHPPRFDWPELDENAPMGLCYTSGTTGDPKGVLYTHRSTYLHTMAQGLTDALGLSAADSVLHSAPMCHVLGWGYPYTATMLGAKQVMLSGHWDAADLLDVVQAERITFCAGVPTIWQSVREAVEAQPDRWDLSSLSRINCAASAPALSLIRWFWERLGVEMIQSWGMTETNPQSVISRRIGKRKHLRLAPEAQLLNVAKTGLPVPGIEVEIVDDAGTPLPHDGSTPGHLLVRGPWVCDGYYRQPESNAITDGWLRTGDIAKLDAEEYLILTDRSKDLIKSGGEWISSIDLENHLLALPGVTRAAVVAQPHPRWMERPVALVVLTPGAELSVETVRAHCASRFAKWQVPDDVMFVSSLPLNGTGKIDKKAIRADLAARGYRLPQQRQ